VKQYLQINKISITNLYFWQEWSSSKLHVSFGL